MVEVKRYLEHLVRRQSVGTLGVLALLATAAFVVARVAMAGSGDITKLIVAGSDFVNPAKVPIHVSVIPGTGYDGQFYFRLAIDPFQLNRMHFGIRLDTPFRAQRIGYPLLAWILSFGVTSLLPYTLVVVNVASLASIAFLGAKLAVLGGRSALYGLLFSGSFGYLLSIGRDLSEVSAGAVALAGLYALRTRRIALACLALSLGVLARETTLVVVGALAISWVWQNRFRFGFGERSNRSSSIDLPVSVWLVPTVLFVVWQTVVRLTEAHIAAVADLRGNLGVPLLAMVNGLVSRLAHPLDPTNAIWLIQYLTLILIVGLAVASLGSSAAQLYEKIALVGMGILTISLSPEIWNNASDFRSLYLLWILSSIVIVDSKRVFRWWIWILPCLTWAITALSLVVFI